MPGPCPPVADGQARLGLPPPPPVEPDDANAAYLSFYDFSPSPGLRCVVLDTYDSAGASCKPARAIVYNNPQTT